MEEETVDKPAVQLLGRNGNAFAVIGACNTAAKKAGWSKEQIETVMDEMMAGDYDHLLHTAMKYFQVE